MRNRQSTKNQFCVSAGLYESGINTAQTLDTRMLVMQEDIMKPEYRRETNEDEATGKEEATEAYDLGALASMSINFKRGKPQHFAFLLAYALGNCPAGAAQGGGFYLHTITPMADYIDGSRSNPTFTLGQAMGDIAKQRFYSCFVKDTKVSLAKDSWATITASIGATGLFDSNVKKLTMTAAQNATALTLSGTGMTKIEGTSAADAKNHIDFIRFQLDSTSQKIYCTVGTVDTSGTADVIAITAPDTSGSANGTYEIVYIPAEAAWATFPAQVSEPPLRTTDFAVVMGGKYNGTTVVGGKTLAGEVKQMEWTFTNEGLEAEFIPGGQSGYATRCIRRARKNSIKFDRDFMDYMLQQYAIDNEDIAISAIASLTTSGGETYTVSIYFPKCRVTKPDIGVDNKLLSEATEIAVLEDETYNSVIVTVLNKVDAYCQAA